MKETDILMQICILLACEMPKCTASKPNVSTLSQISIFPICKAHKEKTQINKLTENVYYTQHPTVNDYVEKTASCEKLSFYSTCFLSARAYMNNRPANWHTFRSELNV